MRLSVGDGLLQCALVVQAQVASKPEKRGAHGFKNQSPTGCWVGYLRYRAWRLFGGRSWGCPSRG